MRLSFIFSQNTHQKIRTSNKKNQPHEELKHRESDMKLEIWNSIMTHHKEKYTLNSLEAFSYRPRTKTTHDKISER